MQCDGGLAESHVSWNDVDFCYILVHCVEEYLQEKGP